VLEGDYEFTFQRGDDLETITGSAGTSVAIPPNVELPADVAPPDFGAMAAALQRNGVQVVEPKPVG
jgi:hypothetical protein